MRRLALAVALSLLTVLPAAAQDAPPPVPGSRIAITMDMDFTGGDLQSIFDTTLEACEAACLANAQCRAFTFNTRAQSCFPKSGVTEVAPYAGAISGRVLPTDAAVLAGQVQRVADLAFLQPVDLEQARSQALDLGNQHSSGEWTAEEHLQSARNMEEAGNPLEASRFTGAALALSDAPDLWLQYARLLLAIPPEGSDRQANAGRALSATVNGFLRSTDPGAQASALAGMADALEAVGRGRDMIPALRLAQTVQPRDDVAQRLDTAIGQYGFRITESTVQSDSARPRICAVFSEGLAASGIDYAPFVQLPEPGLSIEASGQQICVDGVTHGSRYALTFRAGLPAASGETLTKPVTLTQYVRDRSPAVRFPGRAYILPRATASGLPVETVNVTTLDLRLRRLTDRNLLRAIQNDYFARPLDAYQEDYFATEIAEEVWKGSAEVTMEVNRDVTTRLPVDDLLRGLAPGIYALSAAVPGADPYERPAATQWFVVSDLGLTALNGADGLTVLVRSLATAGPRAGVAVQLISRSNAVLAETVTDAEGFARFDAGLTRGTGGAAPALLTASAEAGAADAGADGGADAAAATDLSFLALSEAEFDLSDRGVAGREAAPPLDVFVTTDRGAYRAGESVNVTALARDDRAAASPGLVLIARLMRPDGVEYSRALLPDAGAGGHVGSLPLAASAPRGAWRLDILAAADAPPLASADFLVEDFLPERIDFTATLPAGPVAAGAMPDLTIDARYLFGAPGAGLVAEGDVRLSALGELPGFAGYRFGRHDAPFATVSEPLPAGARTGPDGRLVLPLVLPPAADAAQPLQVTVTARLAEGSGRPVERVAQTLLAPALPVLGIRPMFDGDVAPDGAPAAFSLVAVGPDLAPAPAALRWRINRVETEFQWYALYGQWNWEETTTRTRVAEGDLALTEGPAGIAATLDGGAYELVVERSDGLPGGASMAFWAGWYAPADAGGTTPDTLTVALDKPAYRPGDTARLRLEAPGDGVALVSVLSNRVIARQVVPVTAGPNEIALPVTPDWGAGAYVAASVLRPMDRDSGRNPARALGLAHATVDPGPARLQVAIEAPAEADPRGPLDVAVAVTGVDAGQTAYVTLAAVDQGILNLTGFTDPDPAGYYFGQRRLGVAYRDVYGRLIDGLNGAMGALREGGDAGGALRMEAPPPTEELMAYFSGPVTVGADGRARVSLDLPAFNGTVRLMAVAWSAGGVGQAAADVLVRDPVVVTASLPRFLAPGDDSRLLIDLVHAGGPAGRMGLDVTAEGLALTGPAPGGIDLAAGGKASLSLPIRAGDAPGVARLRVALTTPDGRQLVKDLVLPVQTGDPPVARTTRFDLAPGASFTLDGNAFADLMPGTGSATLAAGPVARFDAPGLLRALDAYPYGCTEQLTSRAMPLLYVGQVAAAMGLAGAADIDARIADAITGVLANQSANGAFGLWQAGSGDLWLDAYVTDFLARARAAGHAVPDLALRTALDNLRNEVNYAADFDSGGEGIAYALQVLAREGAAAIGDLRYYADVKADAFATPLAQAQLGPALAGYGEQTRADAMFARADRMLAARLAMPEAQVWRADYGSDLRDAAAILALATEAGSTAVDTARLTGAIAARGDAGRASTQEAGWMLLATRALIDARGAEGLRLDGEPVDGPLVRMLQDGAATSARVLTNTGSAPVEVTLTTFGVPAEPEPAGGNGYAITRRYFTMEGAEIAPDSVAQGSRMVAVLEVTPFEDGGARLLVEDPLPAGFEIDNPNLLRGGDVAALDWVAPAEGVARAEFRQDRFMAALDWTGAEPFRLAYVVRAVSPGSFRHPAASVADMYRPDRRARTAAGQVTVTP